MKLRYLSGAAFVAAAFAASVAQAQTKTIAIDGSSTVFPVSEAIAEEFQKSTKGAVRVTVGISGTGGGFKKFCRGETDISNGSRPILKEEIEACKQAGIEFYELPLAFDALTVAVSPKNTFIGDCITVGKSIEHGGRKLQTPATVLGEARITALSADLVEARLLPPTTSEGVRESDKVMPK